MLTVGMAKTNCHCTPSPQGVGKIKTRPIFDRVTIELQEHHCPIAMDALTILFMALDPSTNELIR